MMPLAVPVAIRVTSDQFAVWLVAPVAAQVVLPFAVQVAVQASHSLPEQQRQWRESFFALSFSVTPLSAPIRPPAHQ
jgi:hypothetical protein